MKKETPNLQVVGSGKKEEDKEQDKDIVEEAIKSLKDFLSETGYKVEDMVILIHVDVGKDMAATLALTDGSLGNAYLMTSVASAGLMDAMRGA